MRSYNLRAMTVDGEFVQFSVFDVPVHIWPDRFVLAKRPGSPVLLSKSVCRVMDHLPLGEGDIVQVSGKLYRVQYHKGFIFICLDDGSAIPSHLVNEYTLVSTGRESLSLVRFKYKNISFPITSFLGCWDDYVVLSSLNELVDPALIQLSAGFENLNRRMFYGDTYDGCEVIMWRGRPCINYGSSYVELPSKTKLRKAGG